MGKRRRRHIERGERLRAARLKRKLTQEQVALALGMKQSHYSQWERGYKWPDEQTTLEALGAVMDVSYAWLTFGAVNGVTPPAWWVESPRPPIREAEMPAKSDGKLRAKGSRGA